MKLLTPSSRAKFLEGAIADGTEIPRERLEIDRPLLTTIRNGCGNPQGRGSRCYDMEKHPQLRGPITEIVQLGRGPVLRVRGSGLTWENCPARLVGNGVDPCIEIEGRDYPATGWHSFRNLVFANSPIGIKCLPGFYEDNGRFVYTGRPLDDAKPDGDKRGNHADNCSVSNCFFATTRAFVNDNEQAVVWKFRDCVLGPLLPGYPLPNGEDCIADLRRGGDIHLGFEVLRPTALIARVRDYSPHSPKITLDIAQDHFADAPYWLSILSYDGPIWTDANGKPTGPLWNLEGRVLIRGYDVPKMVFDESKLFTGDAARLPQDLWRLRYINMGKTNPLTEYGP